MVRSGSEIYNLVAEIRYTQKEKISKNWDTRTNILLPIIKQPNDERELDLWIPRGRVSTKQSKWLLRGR